MTVCDPIELFDADSLQDPYPLYDKLRAAGAVGQIGDSEFYAVSSWDAVVDVITRVDEFSSNLTATMVYQPDGTITPFTMAPIGGPSHALAVADDPGHAVHRKLLDGRSAAKNDPRTGRLRRTPPTGCGATVFATDDRMDGRRGQPAADDGGRQTHWCARRGRRPACEWDMRASIRSRVWSRPTARRRGVSDGVGGYITDHFARGAANPRKNLLGDLATACAAGELDDVVALSMMITLFAAGGESTASLLGSAAWILATRPDIQQQVRENPALLGAFIDETLRYQPPFRGHYRHVTVDTTLGGAKLAPVATAVVVGCGQPGFRSLRRARRVPARSRRRQRTHHLRERSALLRRRRARAPGSDGGAAPTAGPHYCNRRRGRRSLATEPVGPPARKTRADGRYRRLAQLPKPCCGAAG